LSAASKKVAIAISLLFPSRPYFAVHVCGGSLIALVLPAPVAAILLTVSVATANTYEFGYIALAATPIIIEAAVGQRMTRRAAHQAGRSESL
jgi:hypothetical protein